MERILFGCIAGVLIVLFLIGCVLVYMIDTSMRANEFCKSKGYTSSDYHHSTIQGNLIECGSAGTKKIFRVDSGSVCLTRDKWGDCTKSKYVYKEGK